MTDELVNQVREVVARNQRVPVEAVTLDSTFVDLGLDSLDKVNLLFEVEEEFDISIPDQQVDSIRSVAQMAEGIQKLLDRKRGNAPPPLRQDA